MSPSQTDWHPRWSPQVGPLLPGTACGRVAPRGDQCNRGKPARRSESSAANPPCCMHHTETRVGHSSGIWAAARYRLGTCLLICHSRDRSHGTGSHRPNTTRFGVAGTVRCAPWHTHSKAFHCSGHIRLLPCRGVADHPDGRPRTWGWHSPQRCDSGPPGIPWPWPALCPARHWCTPSHANRGAAPSACEIPSPYSSLARTCARVCHRLFISRN
jgi:hypothetical protein